MRDLSPKAFYEILYKGFPHEPTTKQSLALEKLARYVLDTESNTLFLLRGFAGTGKTTIIADVVKHLWHTKLKTVLLAPTGRAAKVMSQYAHTPAYTIHRKIYFPRKDKGGAIRFV
ncbi:MAG: AAA family ATPase, partial [Flavobacteriaceae bacterium]|nr:AAA family ATPase [Eudoraea sp.]NNJ38757.1 AAA family ATPase [Flavobacteriaceae bacterium]